MKKTNKILSLVLAVVMLLSTMGVSAFAASTSKTGLYKVNGTWCYLKNGVVAKSANGLFKHTNGVWYYVDDGKIDWSKTGLVKHTNGIWYYVEDGRIDWSKTGLVKHSSKWYYVEDGRVNFDFTGLAKRNGIWYYVEDGRVNFDFTGLAKRNGIWYYVKDGRVDFDFTGLAKHNSKWYYVEDGRVDFNFTGLAKHTNGKWYHIKNGVKTTYTGFFEYEPGKWYYVKNGEAKVTYTGLAKHTNGKWYYVKNGTIDFSYTGEVVYKDKVYNVVDGVVVVNTSNSASSISDVVKLINNATAKAAKASYDWTREAKFTRNIDVGGLTSILDGIIKGVDENASLNSVVGGFLGVREQPFSASVVNGQLPESGMEEKYLLKAMALTEGDIAQFRVDGNKYMVQIKDCTNPDANSAWAHASNDYITYADVNSSIAGAVGEGVITVVEGESQANYKNIIMTAVIDNGQLTSLDYSYALYANLTIKVGIKAKGTGAAEMKATYSNFKY